MVSSAVYILSVVGTGRGCVILDVIMHHGPQDGRYSGHNAMSGCSNLPTSIRTQLLGQPSLLSFWFSLGFYYCTFRCLEGRIWKMKVSTILETYPIYLSTICRALIQSNGRRSTIDYWDLQNVYISLFFLFSPVLSNLHSADTARAAYCHHLMAMANGASLSSNFTIQEL